MAHGVPQNAACVDNVPNASDSLSLLTLRFDVPDDRPDWPVLTIRVNGEDPFEDVAKDWRGFDPGKMLGPSSPLVPDDAGSRVAVYRCSCGEPGCGVIAPFIVASPDHRRISWVDFRDYVGVFVGPIEPAAADYDGKPWDLPDIHFDRDQYIAEVQRATNDRSWETPPRLMARLLEERVRPMDLVVPPNLTLRWVSPAWDDEGVLLSFEHVAREGDDWQYSQQILHLASTERDPAAAAEDMAGQLLATSPGDWVQAFGYQVR